MPLVVISLFGALNMIRSEGLKGYEATLHCIGRRFLLALTATGGFIRCSLELGKIVQMSPIGIGR